MASRFICCILCTLCVRLFAQAQVSSTHQLIQDVRLFDGSVVLQRRSVLIENGKISRIYTHLIRLADTEVIEDAGHTLLPGLIDAHVHIPDQAEEAASQALRLGVTSQLDMFSGGDRLKKIKQLESSDRPDLSNLRTAGIRATVPGGHPTQMGGPAIPTITSPDQAQEFVDARIAEGSDYIKIIHDDGSTWTWTNKRVPTLDTPTMHALATSLQVFSIVRNRSGFWQNCANVSRGLNSNCTPIKPESSNLAAMRNTTDGIMATANRKLSTSWVLRTAAGKPRRGISRYCDSRCARGGKLSCGL